MKAELTSTFSIVDIGLISFYLHLKVEQNREKKTIKLFHLAYIKKIFEKYHLSKANTINTPMRESKPLLPRIDGKATPSERETYQKMTRSLIFSIVETRPNITFSNSVVSQFANNLLR